MSRSTGSNPQVSVVIVSYNTREWLGKCLEALPAAAKNTTIEMIVVDNASADGSVEFVKDRFPDVRLVRNRINHGFARAVNQGADVSSGEYILLINPDGHMEPGAVDALVSFARANPQYVICGGRTITPDGELEPRSCWAAPTVWSLASSALLLSTIRPGSRIFDPEAMGYFGRDHPRTVDIVSGCLMLIARSDWQELDGFDERYFVYGEDADLCLRATAQTGRQCAITPEALMVHAVSASSNSRPDKHELLLNGRIALVRSHLRGWRGPVGAALIIAGVAVRAAIERLGVSRGTNWREVWHRRERWRRGYAAAGHASGAVATRAGGSG